MSRKTKGKAGSRSPIYEVGYMGDPGEKYVDILSLRQLIDEGHIDPEIKDLVRDLNIRGYRTFASCSGDQYPMGIIALSYPKSGRFTRGDYDRIKQIVRRYTSVPYMIEEGPGGVDLLFRGPIGRPVEEKDLIDMGEFLGTRTDEDTLKIVNDPNRWIH